MFVVTMATAVVVVSWQLFAFAVAVALLLLFGNRPHPKNLAPPEPEPLHIHEPLNPLPCQGWHYKEIETCTALRRPVTNPSAMHMLTRFGSHVVAPDVRNHHCHYLQAEAAHSRLWDADASDAMQETIVSAALSRTHVVSSFSEVASGAIVPAHDFAAVLMLGVSSHAYNL